MSRVSCRSSHLNFDRFHQPCLLPGRTSRIGGACRFPVPRGGHLPFAGSPALPPLRLTGGFCHADQTVPRQDVNSSFSPCVCHLHERCLHTRRLGPSRAAACYRHALGTPSPWPHVRHTFQSYSHRFVGIDNLSIISLVFRNIAVGFHTTLHWYFARHCCWHRNFQLSTSGFHCELEFFIVWFNEEYSSQLSGIVELRLLDSPLLLRFAFRCIRHMLPHIWPHIVGSSGCLIPRQSPPGPCISIRWPLVQ